MNKLIESLHQIGAIKFGEFLLKSGKKSPVYIDLRQVVSYPKILKQIADAMRQQMAGCQFDFICGVPYTALPIATCISITHDIPMVMRRKEKKDYGTKQKIEGNFQAGQRCLIIEDVITTGSSILETANDILAAGLTIHHACALVDREEGGIENLQQKNITTHTVFTLSQILNER